MEEARMNLMKNVVGFAVRGKDGTVSSRTVEVKTLCLARNCGRDVAAAKRPLDSFRAQGYAVHENANICKKSKYLLTNDEAIEVQGPQTSGEVEVVAIFDGADVFVSVGSDHGDRTIETMWTDALGKVYDTAKIKQMCPCVVAKDAWLYGDVKDHWDRLRLKSYITLSGRRTAYQDSDVSALLDLEFHLKNNPWLRKSGTVLFCGTVDTLKELPPEVYQFQQHCQGLVFPTDFYFELHDPVLNRSISHVYRVSSVEPQGSLSL
jgi:hypothetical protein